MVNKYLSATMQHALQIVGNGMLNRCLPQYCMVCRLPANSQLALCHNCHILLLKQSLIGIQQCLRCALPMDHSSLNQPLAALLCPRCIATAPAFSRCIAALRYERLSGYIINRFKHSELLAARGVICALMIEAIQQRYTVTQPQLNKKPFRAKPSIDLIVPVPLHTKRLRQRGFNQALELAKPIAKHFNLPLAMNACCRIKHSSAQQTLNSRQRAKNLDNAFEAYSEQVAGRRVAIIDDVVTTTHTARSLAKTLVFAGAVDCEVWCFARTPTHN
jgi:ComF family protein